MSRVKGARFEVLIANYLRPLLGDHLVRPRAGAARDRGDIAGVPRWTFELKNIADPVQAVNDGLRDLRVEQDNAGTDFGAAIIKRRRIAEPERQLFVMELGPAVPLIAETMLGGRQ